MAENAGVGQSNMDLISQMQQKNELFQQLGSFLTQVQEDGASVAEKTKQKLAELETVSVQRDALRAELDGVAARAHDLASNNEQLRTERLPLTGLTEQLSLVRRIERLA